MVEVTEEAKAELAKIENKIGDYICQLCKEIFDDAFGLAQHRLAAPSFFNINILVFNTITLEILLSIIKMIHSQLSVVAVINLGAGN